MSVRRLVILLQNEMPFRKKKKRDNVVIKLWKGNNCALTMKIYQITYVKMSNHSGKCRLQSLILRSTARGLTGTG